MNRVLTMDQVIGVEALRLSLGQSIISSDNYVYGIMKTLQINNDSIAEMNLIDSYIAGQVKIMDVLSELGAMVTDGKEENQFQGQGGESGAEAIGGAESDPAVSNEADESILRQHRGG